MYDGGIVQNSGDIYVVSVQFSKLIVNFEYFMRSIDNYYRAEL